MYKLKRTLLIAATLVGLSACASTPETAEESNYVRVTGEQIETFYGKRITLQNNYIIVEGDGTFSGNWNGSSISGTWEYKDGYWCRNLPTSKTPNDCQLWESDGDKLRVTRNKGKGDRFDYEVN